MSDTATKKRTRRASKSNKKATRERPWLHDARPADAQRQPGVRSGTLLALAGAGLVASGVAGALLGGSNPRRPARAAKLAGYGAALLAASVLADSAMEHYRGNFRRRTMFVAPVMAAVTLATGLWTAISRGGGSIKNAIFGASMMTGLFGFGFHIRNIRSRPGGFNFNNFFYRAPFGAPGALLLAGAAGVGGVAATRCDTRERLGEDGRHRRAGRLLGLVTASGLFGLTAEIGLLHFRGAYHDKLMYAPVLAVPLTGAALTAAALAPTEKRNRVARGLLETTGVLGAAGVGLHAYGVSRNMGGFANWTQNLFQGPPIAAPPSLTGIALIGISALDLLGRRHRQGDEA